MRRTRTIRAIDDEGTCYYYYYYYCYYYSSYSGVPRMMGPITNATRGACQTNQERHKQRECKAGTGGRGG
ncbi:hypothetical protein E2C01_096495 [Portunus trituberculatus]|uniref:Uncharacterized protein n=1 Tax=Portunus trituberculatus TaxID=210409 RepID=A0A5B7K8D6_PORTR|nr:hypothetical protein [Portunus trituberculatus]